MHLSRLGLLVHLVASLPWWHPSTSALPWHGSILGSILSGRWGLCGGSTSLMMLGSCPNGLHRILYSITCLGVLLFDPGAGPVLGGVVGLAGCASGVLGVQCGPTCLLHLWMVGEVVSAGGLHLFAAAV